MFGLIPRRREREGERALTAWEHTPLDLLRQEFATLYDRAFGGMPMMLGEALNWGLTVEEGEQEVVVRAEVPGFEASEIDVRLTGDLLTIRAEHPGAKAPEGARPVMRRSERVERSVTLPAGIVPDKIEARYHSGVLEVHIPRSPEVQPRRIEVKT